MSYDLSKATPHALPMLDPATLEPTGQYRPQILAPRAFTYQCADPDCHCHSQAIRVIWDSDDWNHAEAEALTIAADELERIRAGFSDRDHP